MKCSYLLVITLFLVSNSLFSFEKLDSFDFTPNGNLFHLEDDTQVKLDHLKLRYASLQKELLSVQKQMNLYGYQPESSPFHLAKYPDNFDFNAQYAHQTFNQNNNSQSGSTASSASNSDAETAKESLNPVGTLWMLWFQNDMTLNEGPIDGKRIFDTILFQPVVPIRLTEQWNLITRPIMQIPIYELPNDFTFDPGGSFPPTSAITNPFSTEGEFGDFVVAQFLSKKPKGKFTSGIGWTWSFPSATDPRYGTGKTSVGPALVALNLGDKAVYGTVLQQWFSIEGAESRDRVSLMDMQIFYRYRFTPFTSLGGSPNLRWNQVTGKWTVPIGIGVDSLLKINKMPVRVGAEIQYFASHEGRDENLDPEWNFRMYFIPIIKSPKWANTPIFGSNRSCCRRCY